MTIREYGGEPRKELSADDLAKLSPSVLCSRTGIQNCHFCDRLDCGDNISPAVTRLRIVEAELATLSKEVVDILEAPEPVRLATAAALRLGDPMSDVLEILGKRPNRGRRIKVLR